ncbi:MAG TPA: hypothetical protein VIW94_07350 [Acidimicrobiia bacterium]
MHELIIPDIAPDGVLIVYVQLTIWVLIAAPTGILVYRTSSQGTN